MPFANAIKAIIAKKNILIPLGLAAGVVLAGTAIFSWQINRPGRPAGTKIISFAIEEGEGARAIGRNLQAVGLIRSHWEFEAYAWLEGKARRFQAGEYEIPGRASIKTIAIILASGKTVPREMTITTLEGWTAGEIGDYLEKEGIVGRKDFLAAVGNLSRWTEKYPFLMKELPAGASLEGYLFPDTYRIYRDATPDDIIAKMLDSFDRRLTLEMRQSIAAAGRSVFEIVTLASIIEREVPTDEDRRMIADVFYKRLAIGQPLQADSTVAYALGINKARYTTEDVQADSPYNTYKNQGLPPGPIGNPGLSAIEAAVYPAKNDYWYFLSKNDGGTVFSKTFEEHILNKAKYLK